MNLIYLFIILSAVLLILFALALFIITNRRKCKTPPKIRGYDFSECSSKSCSPTCSDDSIGVAVGKATCSDGVWDLSTISGCIQGGCSSTPAEPGYIFPDSCKNFPNGGECYPLSCSSDSIGASAGSASCSNGTWDTSDVKGCFKGGCVDVPVVPGFDFPDSCKDSSPGESCTPTGCAPGYIGKFDGYPPTCKNGSWDTSAEIEGCYPSKGAMIGVLMDEGKHPYPPTAPKQIKGWLWIKGTDGNAYNLLSLSDCAVPGACVLFSHKPNGDANIIKCIPCN